ncbi:MAG: hypothetical protein KGQ52_01050 [Alphaproteobacteria bacterium]|nr:hypothetical protein [Alphaproteobacteria bacterium]
MRLLLPLLLIAAPVAAAPASAPQPGTVRACVPLALIRGTTVVDGQTIDFTLRDGSRWRNRLPGGNCVQLGFERAFAWETSMSQLCRQDLITVLQNMGGLMPGARCGLGDFVALPPPPPKPGR